MLSVTPCEQRNTGDEIEEREDAQHRPKAARIRDVTSTGKHAFAARLQNSSRHDTEVNRVSDDEDEEQRSRTAPRGGGKSRHDEGCGEEQRRQPRCERNGESKSGGVQVILLRAWRASG